MADRMTIWDASLEELTTGYVEDAEHYRCLCCGDTFEKGIIYPVDDRLYEAEKYTRRHIAQEHGSVFAYLTGLDKTVTGLSELQKRLLLGFYQGKSDTDLQKELGIGSTSTIRNHRFQLKEKERQAKVFLAIMELLRTAPDPAPAREHTERTPGSGEPVLKKYFPQGAGEPLKSFPRKKSHRMIVLTEIASHFDPNQRYTEREIDQVLATLYTDYVTLRRYLIDYGFLSRQPDGSQYWRTQPGHEQEENEMDRRKELRQLAKEVKTEAGIYMIKNNRNGKVFVESARALKSMNGRRFELEQGTHMNKALQHEWNQFGADAFSFEVLEVLERPETGYFDEKDALQKMKERWLERLQPYGERGYNSPGELKRATRKP